MTKVEFTITQMLHRGWTCELAYYEDKSGPKSGWADVPKVFCTYFRKSHDEGIWIAKGRQPDLWASVEQARDDALAMSQGKNHG